MKTSHLLGQLGQAGGPAFFARSLERFDLQPVLLNIELLWIEWFIWAVDEGDPPLHVARAVYLSPLRGRVVKKKTPRCFPQRLMAWMYLNTIKVR